MKQNSWDQVVTNPDGTVSFKTFDGSVYFTSTKGARVGGTFYPEPYRRQLQNDLGLMVRDEGLFKEAVRRLSAYPDLEIPIGLFPGEHLKYLRSIIEHDTDVIDSGGPSSAMQGWSPYLGIQYLNDTLGIYINLWAGMDQYDKRGLPRPNPPFVGTPGLIFLGPVVVKSESVKPSESIGRKIRRWFGL